MANDRHQLWMRLGQVLDFADEAEAAGGRSFLALPR